MHVIQYVATQADSVDEAHRSVKSYLEDQLGSGDTYTTWFDWFVTGGGRWASDENAQYDDNYTADVAHQDTPKFQEYLDTAHKYKLEVTQQVIDSVRKINLEEICDNVEQNQEGLYPMWDITSKLYEAHKLYTLVSGTWDCDSYFFDTVHDSTHPKYMREAIDKGDKNWYLVPVDFHF